MNDVTSIMLWIFLLKYEYRHYGYILANRYVLY